MLRLVRQIVARMLGRRPPVGRPPTSGSPRDPYAGVREPRRRPPGGRGSAVAVAEPEPDQFVRAIGTLLRRERSR